MSAEVLSTINMHCPHCDELTDDATSADPEALPSVGDATICAFCTGVGIYTETHIRKATDEEVRNLLQHREFRRAMAAAQFMQMLHPGHGSVMEVEVENEGHEGAEHPHHHHAHVISVGPDGIDGLEGLDLPPVLQDVIQAALHRIEVERKANEIKHFVTQEVANHVLSIYGNEDASMPSVTIGALISLIRLAHDSDELMMMNLNLVEDFHGYVIAVILLAEQGPSGIAMLEKLAGLRPAGKEQDVEV